MTSRTVRLGIDVACRSKHRASLADEAGQFVWTGRRFGTTPPDLDALWEAIPDDAAVTVVMEPTRNAWVPLAAWLQAHGADVVLVPPEQSADLRDYYNKHTKTDRLDSRVLARLPLLHPEGLQPIDSLGPAEPLKRAVRRRSSLIKRRSATFLRIDALLELLGPVWADVLGSGEHGKTVLAVLERCADPRALKRLGRRRLTALLVRHSRGAWREDKADALLAAADETLALWQHGAALDFAELAEDLAGEARLARQLTEEIAAADERITALYGDADPAGIVVSVPGLQITLAAGILGRLGDPHRFADLAGVRAFTGLVPGVDQSGNRHRHGPPTKAGDPGLREALYLAAEQVRKVDPTFAAKYHRLIIDQGKHHVSAICTLAPMLATRIAACWRNGERYVLRDVDGTKITETDGRKICAQRYTVPPQVRAARRKTSAAKQHKKRTDRREKKSTDTAAPAPSPSTTNRTEKAVRAA
ncbi:MAG: IS110 family transposase [Nitriliruptorales bacterium]|nr:IS110 family transposase [Nitriliruptorales bacterium]